MTLACRAGVAALVLFSSSSALAQVSSVEQVRFLGAFGTIRGTELVASGSRDPYLGVLLEGDLEITALFKKWIGIDVDLRVGNGGTKSASGDRYEGRGAVAAIVPVLRRDGPRGYSLLVGAGGGFTAGDRYWWADFRAYPYVLARFTYLFTQNVSTFAQASVAPIDTSLAAHTWAVESQYEAGVGVGLFFAGARVAFTAIQGGEPERTFGDLELGFYLGLGVRFQPAKKRVQ